MVKYRDSSFVIIDRIMQSPTKAIMGFQYGHFEEITGLTWFGSNRSRQVELVTD